MPPFARISRLVYKSKFPRKVASFGDVRVDFLAMELVRNGGEVPLTVTEFKLLAFLLQNPKRVISRKEILDAIWGDHTDPATRTVDMHISKLRQKVEKDPANPIHVRTVHCAGYKFVP
jgi:two-component system, OmpR family, alkaline phosphatase synthesis response regulator PhoP